MVLHLEPLRPPTGDRHDPRAEGRRARRFRCAFGSPFPLLQQPGIDLLLPEVLVDFFCAAAFQNDAGDPRHAVPDGEIGDRCAARHREQIVSFQHAALVAREDLSDRYTRIAIVDANVDSHPIERQNRGIRARAPGRNQHARIAQQ